MEEENKPVETPVDNEVHEGTPASQVVVPEEPVIEPVPEEIKPE